MEQRPYRPAPTGNGMNRQRVIISMTIAVFFMLGVPLTAIFGGLPPWPIIFWFAASHIFFCVLIIRTKPFTGPYKKPYTDPTLKKVERS